MHARNPHGGGATYRPGVQPAGSPVGRSSRDSTIAGRFAGDPGDHLRDCAIQLLVRECSHTPAVPRRIPPLNGLRVFEAVARHLNMSQAARELCMTQGAVSQQIRNLEGYLTIALFHRQKPGLSLTEAGQRLFHCVSPALASMTLAAEAIRRIAASGGVILSTLASIASRWLLPRVKQLEAMASHVALQLDVSRAQVRFDVDNVDLAIRFGGGRWTGVTAERLFSLKTACLSAVPQSAGASGATLESLLAGKERLLCDPRHDYWGPWAARHGIDRSQLEHRMVLLDDHNVLIQALLDGHGVAIVPLFMVVAELRLNRLSFVDPEPLSFEGGYWLVYPSLEEQRSSVRLVMDWLRGEASRSEREVEQLLSGLRAKTHRPPPRPGTAKPARSDVGGRS